MNRNSLYARRKKVLALKNLKFFFVEKLNSVVTKNEKTAAVQSK